MICINEEYKKYKKYKHLKSKLSYYNIITLDQ